MKYIKRYVNETLSNNTNMYINQHFNIVVIKIDTQIKDKTKQYCRLEHIRQYKLLLHAHVNISVCVYMLT